MDLGERSLETTLDKADAVYNALKPDQTRQVAGAITKENSDSTDKSESERPAAAAFHGKGRGTGRVWNKGRRIDRGRGTPTEKSEKAPEDCCYLHKRLEKGHITAELCHPALVRVMFLNHKRNQISEIETS